MVISGYGLVSARDLSFQVWIRSQVDFIFLLG